MEYVQVLFYMPILAKDIFIKKPYIIMLVSMCHLAQVRMLYLYGMMRNDLRPKNM